MDIRKWIKKKEPAATTSTSDSELLSSVEVDSDSVGPLTPLTNTQKASVRQKARTHRHRQVCQRTSVKTSQSSTGFNNWKHATDKAKGFHRHANSKEHLACMAIWKEQQLRFSTGKEISTLLSRNRLYVSAIIDIIEFLVSNELPLRGAVDSVEDRGQAGSGLFLSLFDYTLRKNKELAQAFSTIPKNATYTSHDVQNDLIELMSTIVTEHIVKDVGESWFTVKVDGTKDPTGSENVSIVLRYVDQNCSVKERLLSMLTTDKCDALSLSNMVLEELADVGLDTGKILSQCYDGASVMSGREGGMQKLIQNKLNSEVPYIHCFNHQLHLAIVHAVSSESAVEDFFDVCNALYKFLRKPTVAAQYKGQKLKRLLDQRWTGHLDTVSVVLKSHNTLVEFLNEIATTRKGADIKLEAVGLHKAITEPAFKFLSCVMYKVLGLTDPPNRMLQAEQTNLMTAVQLIRSASSCIESLRSDAEFAKLWAESIKSSDDAVPTAPKRQRQASKSLQDYIVNESVGQRESNIEQECKRLFFNIIDSILGEMSVRFSERNSQYMSALDALDPGSKNFLDAGKVKPLLDLRNTEMNVFSEHRRSMLHRRKAHLIKLAFENDLSRKFREEWKELLLRSFHSSKRRLQLY
ncbi:Zinc finger MYM-type protein 1 [Labeo rohita]|uniref:Zinc finger MYM-type protein 1 n=1 Tax=Labeo rohita TaxID=84645 RepID=A0ABQ8M7I1_LABRO|nr:Zinc finger MYM-type protein 1 [Labeo rohita]